MRHTPADVAVADSDVRHLSLPEIGTDTRYSGGHGTRSSTWERQTYETFASRTRKLNPSAKFTKVLMDDSFRFAVSRVSKSALAKSREAAGVERMMKRCLGKESDQYWAKQSKD
ncbi:hypothetical protein LTR56_010527 [Elasticomyces elasticus]|nr:hypothetical protein LTR56_010527 [Elasticomyces elasticus]KAK3657943.1 hypothetical protein LTR22_009170 [Elasticomyces elasticus]KAK5762850.1 hypothetical protein LTS12_007039 [Elasticomyces elasticus]